MIEIQKATASHIPDLAAIERAAASIFGPEDLPLHLRNDTVPLKEHETAQRHGLLLVALNDREPPIGYAVTHLCDQTLHLAQLDVHPDHQRQGVGSRLLEGVIRLGRQNRANGIVLTTFRHVRWNAPWYQTFGFRILDEHEISPFLREILINEKKLGLNPNLRVAMEKTLV